MYCLNLKSLITVSHVLAKYFEGLLEASDEGGHVAQSAVLVLESVGQLGLQIIHKLGGFVGALCFEVVQELVR